MNLLQKTKHFYLELRNVLRDVYPTHSLLESASLLIEIAKKNRPITAYQMRELWKPFIEKGVEEFNEKNTGVTSDVPASVSGGTEPFPVTEDSKSEAQSTESFIEGNYRTFYPQEVLLIHKEAKDEEVLRLSPRQAALSAVENNDALLVSMGGQKKARKPSSISLMVNGNLIKL